MGQIVTGLGETYGSPEGQSDCTEAQRDSPILDFQVRMSEP